jgi:Mg-chelatase subunit ChlD
MTNTFSTTHYLLILDRSGSMHSCWTSTMNALETQIRSIYNLAEENPEMPIKTNVVLFNTDMERILENAEVKQLAVYKKTKLEPFGGTALLDAVGTSLHRLKSVMKPDDDAVVVILTDGEENASTVYSYAEIEKLISHLKETNKWKFTLVGADFDAFSSIGSRVGISRNESRTFSKAYAHAEFEALSADFSKAVYDKKQGKGIFGK